MTTATQKTPSGYKQTDVGVIPADWDVLDYVSFGKVIDGDRGIQYPGTRDFTDVGFCLFLNAGNVTKSGFRFTDCQFISAEKDRRLGNGKLTRGDVVLTTRGTVGNLAFFDDKTPFDQIRINSGMVILRNTSSTVDTAYQYMMLRSRIIMSQIEHLSFGSAQPQLTVKGINTLKIPIPPTKDEQEAIASILLDTDVLIDKLEKLIDKKKNVKSGTMQELLTGKRRLPGFSGKWETKRLGEVTEFDHGRDLPKSDLSEDGPYRCIHYGQLFNEYRELISGIKSRTHTNTGRFYSKANDVLMPTSDVTPRGLATASCIKEDGVILGGGILVIRLHSGYDGLYFSYFVSQNRNTVLRFVKGSTVFHLYANDLSNFEVNFPELKEQVAIATVLSDMDTEIEKLESQLTKYQNLKQGMMQVLLTGKVRLLSK